MRNEGRNPVTSRSVRSRQANIHQRCILISSHAMSHPYGPYPTPVGFEPTRGDPIGLAGRRLSRSAKVSMAIAQILYPICRQNKQVLPTHRSTRCILISFFCVFRPVKAAASLPHRVVFLCLVRCAGVLPRLRCVASGVAGDAAVCHPGVCGSIPGAVLLLARLAARRSVAGDLSHVGADPMASANTLPSPPDASPGLARI